MKIVSDIKEKLEKNEKILMPVFLFLGFIVDWFTLNRVDQVFDNLILLTYIILSAVSIIFMNGFFKGKFLNKIKDISPYILQYAFGGLFSGLVIFYFRSSHIFTSLPFLIILIVLFLGNDFLHRKYQRLVFQILVFYIAIFSYLNLIIPILFKTISVWIFVTSSILSIVVISGYIMLVNKIVVNERFRHWAYRTVYITLGIFIFLYTTNIIPPIPLSLKDSNVAHDIQRIDDREYVITLQDTPWYVFWSKYTDNLNVRDGDEVYVFSSVFAPTRFRSTIYHEWSYFDTEINRWRRTDRIPMEILGGQNNGYRGYSVKSNLIKGDWRVDIKTETNQIIGRVGFKIKDPNKEISLTKIVR